MKSALKYLKRFDVICLIIICLVPLLDRLLPLDARIGNHMIRIFIYAVMALGLNIVVGYCGLLHLGIAAFVAMGAYIYAILTVSLYPFQIGFWPSLLIVPLAVALVGILLGIPTLRLRGDYLAIVTLGFGEIMKDVLKNLEVITKGTQGINPLPGPEIFSFKFETLEAWYFLFVAFMVFLVIFNRNLERSKLGRALVAIREDELAATCMGISPSRIKLYAFAIGAGFAGLAGVMMASNLTTTGDPGSYDFNVSITVLCIIIIGGIGSINGVLLGALILMGFDTIIMNKILDLMQRLGAGSSTSVFLSPTNWKWLIFGLVLVLMTRYRREGILPSSRLKAELTGEAEKPNRGAQ